MTCKLYSMMRALPYVKNIHINLFKHGSALSLCLSETEERESSANQTHPEENVTFSFFLAGGTMQAMLTLREQGEAGETTTSSQGAQGSSRACRCRPKLPMHKGRPRNGKNPKMLLSPQTANYQNYQNYRMQTLHVFPVR